GALVGAVVAAGILLIRKRTRDPVLETVIALVTPYTSYVLAESVHTSGVTAVIVASVVIGTQSERVTTAGQRLQLTAVYQTVIFLLESVVFALIGLQLPTLIRALAGSGINWFVPGLILTGTLLVVRILWVFPLSALRAWRHDKRRPSWQAPAVISWAGARGVVPLAAALSIPLVTNSGAPLAQRDLVLVLATMVIVVTLVVQGFTLAPLVRASGLAVESATSAAEQSNARLALAKASLSHLDEVADLEGAPEVVVTRLRHSLMARIDRLQQRVDN